MNDFWRLLAATLLLFGLTTMCNSLLAQQFYRWVDENGVEHFSQTPPEGRSAELDSIPQTHLTRGTGGPIGGSDTPAGSSENMENQQNSTAQQAAADPRAPTPNEEMCRRIRANLNMLQNRTRAQMVDPDTGETRMMGIEDIESERTRLQDLLSKHCQ
jgi:hypothetical protein